MKDRHSWVLRCCWIIIKAGIGSQSEQKTGSIATQGSETDAAA